MSKDISGYGARDGQTSWHTCFFAGMHKTVLRKKNWKFYVSVTIVNESQPAFTYPFHTYQVHGKKLHIHTIHYYPLFTTSNRKKKKRNVLQSTHGPPAQGINGHPGHRCATVSGGSGTRFKICSHLPKLGQVRSATRVSYHVIFGYRICLNL